MTEQEAFEAWATREGWHMSKPRYDKNRQYTSPKTQTLWEGWQARATPADQLQPTKNEPPPMPKVKPVRFVCAMCEDAPTWPNNPCMSCKRLDYQAIATPADHSTLTDEQLKQHFLNVSVSATPADHIAVSGKEIWEYRFVHSSALGRRDEMVTMLTYEKADAFRPECSDQKLVCSVGMFVAEVSQDSNGFKHIADVVELDDIPAGTRLYAIAAGNVAAPHPEALSVRDAWQAIATAPKDRVIWAFNGEQARMVWLYDLWIWDDQLASDADPEPEQPTHWMPMPAPPQKPVSDEVKP